MKEIEFPEKNLIIREDGKLYAFYPYSSYMYIFNLVCMYKAQAITKNKLRKLVKFSVYTEELVDSSENIQDIVMSIIDDELSL